MANTPLASLNVFVATTLFLLATIYDISASKCVSESSCSCLLEDGSNYDLHKLSDEGILTTNNTQHTFKFQACKNVKISFDKKESPACDGVSLCAHPHNASLQDFSLGTVEETTWSVTPQAQVLMLSHEKIMTHVKLNCSKTTQSNLRLDGQQTPMEYKFILTTPYACKVAPTREGLSAGSILVIILLVLSGVYLLVGTLTLRLSRGAVGWESMPNYDFWSELPGLVRDGVTFTFSGCSPDSYDRI